MEWISVKDRLPEIDQKVVFIEKNIKLPDVGIYNINDGIEEWYVPANDDVANNENVTHWMPLPEPPKTKDRSLKDTLEQALQSEEKESKQLIKDCFMCEKKTEHRVIYACNECEKYI